jgi:hypothetical protein
MDERTPTSDRQAAKATEGQGMMNLRITTRASMDQQTPTRVRAVRELQGATGDRQAGPEALLKRLGFGPSVRPAVKTKELQGTTAVRRSPRRLDMMLCRQEVEERVEAHTAKARSAGRAGSAGGGLRFRCASREGSAHGGQR